MIPPGAVRVVFCLWVALVVVTAAFVGGSVYGYGLAKIVPDGGDRWGRIAALGALVMVAVFAVVGLEVRA